MSEQEGHLWTPSIKDAHYGRPDTRPTSTFPCPTPFRSLLPQQRITWLSPSIETPIRKCVLLQILIFGILSLRSIPKLLLFIREVAESEGGKQRMPGSTRGGQQRSLTAEPPPHPQNGLLGRLKQVKCGLSAKISSESAVSAQHRPATRTTVRLQGKGSGVPSMLFGWPEALLDLQ